MLALPRVEGEALASIRSTLLRAAPTGDTVTDFNLAMDVAVHAVNESLATAERVLGNLEHPGTSEATRMAALVMYLAIAHGHSGAIRQLTTDAIVELAPA